MKRKDNPVKAPEWRTTVISHRFLMAEVKNALLYSDRVFYFIFPHDWYRPPIKRNLLESFVNWRQAIDASGAKGSVLLTKSDEGRLARRNSPVLPKACESGAVPLILCRFKLQGRNAEFREATIQTG